MKCQLVIVLVIVGMTIIASSTVEAQNDANSAANSSTLLQTVIPHPKHISTINLKNLGRESWVRKLAFSPDGRYLAILDDPTVTSGELIIWDLQNNREQTKMTGLYPFVGYDQQVEILWGPDGKYIFFGIGPQTQFWDPMTGEVLKEESISTHFAKLNRDRSKLLALIDPGSGFPTFRIYDATTWEYTEYGNDGLAIHTLSWTTDDKVIVAGTWPKRNVGRNLDRFIPKMGDAFARLIDPSGKQHPQSVLLASSVPSGINNPPFVETFSPNVSIVDYAENKVALSTGGFKVAIGSASFVKDHIMVLDGCTLKTLYAYSPSQDDLKNGKMPGGDSGMAFSPDGKFLYLMGDHRNGQAKSFILNAMTGALIATFPGGRTGFAVSPDGRQMAIGNGQSVELFSIQ
jgi:WD40 repeat protein